MSNTQDKHTDINGNTFYPDRQVDLKKMTNEEFLSYCLNFSSYGAMCQSVIIDALEKGCRVVLSQKEQIIKDCDEGKYDRYIVNMRSWVGCFEELNRRLSMKYGYNQEH